MAVPVPVIRLALVLAFVLGSATPTTLLPNPSISSSKLVGLIERSLAQSAPTLIVALGKRVGDHAPLGYADLERAGVLQQWDVGSSCERGPAYRLTEKGKAEAAERGWQVYDSVVIPVGRLQYVTGSAVILRKPDPILKGGKDTYEVAFKYRFAGNSNARYLLSLGPGDHWLIHNDKLPGTRLSVGRISTMTLLLYRWHGVWSVAKIPYYEDPPCGTP